VARGAGIDFGCSPAQAYSAGILHDIGKIFISDEILEKRFSLTDREWEVMKRHPVWGREFVRGTVFDSSDELKTEYRERRITLTKAIAGILEQAVANAEGEYLFTMENGATFTAEKFQRQVWVRALKKAGVKYRKPYTTRHSFAAWALAIRIDQNRLVNLMGHASKQMIYEVYGRYVEGLERDRLKILAYFGRDFKRGG